MLGWLVFLVALVTYTLTAEETASFWDCGEFIAAAYKLQVPHPPGAPFFLLLGRLFSLLSFGDVTKVAFWVNMVSVISSALTILFLFWTITRIALKLTTGGDSENLTTAQKITILGSGIVGSLAYTFSDSFWFSAVEAEVYAISSFFTAFVFWAMLKWEEVANSPESDKWLILIAYMMGLSIGVHLLNLVTIPALGFIFYFKKYTNITLKGILLTFVISLFLVLGILEVIIPGLPSFAGSVEIFFVNTLGLPFNSGIIFFMVVFIGCLIYLIKYSIYKQNRILNTVLLCFTFLLIGYTSYAIILIRSSYNPPIDENNPENVISFVSYLKREQYGDRPLFYGPQYTADVISQKKGSPIYRKEGDKYMIFDYKMIYKFDPRHETLIPRMYSKQPSHIQAYEEMVGKPEIKVPNSRSESKYKPSFRQNIEFMLKGQFGEQYLRYFLWNFLGRFGDIQGTWSPGIFQSKKDLPETIASNKAYNQFYGIPLLIGILGFAFHTTAFRNKKDCYSFVYVTLFFVLTGLALSFYLNQPPIEPRERDYIFAGSFYVFAIWIGIGVLAIEELIRIKLLKKSSLSGIIAILICIPAPILMAKEGWDDHDRSKRWHSVDSAKNLLNSCEKNAILFTGGDNDTFPLWYVQEVEGFRTDVRVCNLSLLNTDWYIDQMKLKAYESEPLPISLEFKNYAQGTNDYIPYIEDPRMKGGILLKNYIKFVKNFNPEVCITTEDGRSLAKLPITTMILPVDSQKVAEMGIVPDRLKKNIVSVMKWDLPKRSLEKKDLIILDIIASNDWKRPIYFSTTLSSSSYLNLKDYMQMEGLAYRLIPVKNPPHMQGEGRVETSIMYNRMINNFFYRGLDDTTRYFDENYRRFPMNLRNSFYRLAAEFYNEGNFEKAKEVVDFCFAKIPDKTFNYDAFCVQFVQLYYKLNEKEKAQKMALVMAKRADDELNYYKQNDRKNFEVRTNMYILNTLSNIARTESDSLIAKEIEEKFNKHIQWAIK